MAYESSGEGRWATDLRVSSVRIVRASFHYEAAVRFYRDLVGLRVIDEFRDSYGEDGTIFGLPSWPTHLEVVRSRSEIGSIVPFDQIVFYLPDEAAVVDATRELLADGVNPLDSQHPYWEDNGGITFLDPDGRSVVYVSWVYGPHLRETPGNRQRP
jgi:catechol 2,3-dioxygenase-like lactoylglutathione lyase family enzyme